MAFTKVLPAGLSTTSTLTVDSLDSVGAVSASSITATTGTFSGNVSIAGTLTYEDVTNIDSVGLITARSGIHVTGGSVGIGTDNPQEKLHVQGDVRLVDNSPRIGFHDANASTNIQCTGGIELFDQNGNRGAYMGATEGSNFLSFGISPSAGANPTEKLRITSSGNVGINTTIPESPLEIMGDSTIGDAKITFNRAPTVSNDGVIGELFFQNNTDSVALISAKRESAADDAYIQFATQASGGGLTERLRITSGGDVNVAAGGSVFIGNGNLVFSTSGTGIDFSATADGSGTTTSELLDDYEEGTFTPTLVTNGGSGGVGGYGNRGGSYTKIGRKVTIYGRLTITNKGTLNGAIAIGNLPFTCAGTVDTTSLDGWGVLNYFAGVDGSNTTDFISVSNIEDTNLAILYRGNQTGAMSGMDQGHITNAFDCRFGITYQTTS